MRTVTTDDEQTKQMLSGHFALEEYEKAYRKNKIPSYKSGLKTAEHPEPREAIRGEFVKQRKIAEARKLISEERPPWDSRPLVSYLL